MAGDWVDSINGVANSISPFKNTVENFLFGKKRKYSDKAYLAALDRYQQKVDQNNAAASSAYQTGENADLANLKRFGAESRAAGDQSAISRGLYNTTVAGTQRNRATEAENEGYSQVAANRGQFLNTLKPSMSVYGPLIAARAANPSKATTKRDLGAEFDARNTAIQNQQLAAFQGGKDSAAGQIAANGQSATPGLGAAGAAMNRRNAESQKFSQALNTGATVSTIQGGAPDPSLNGQLIQQIAAQPVKQTGIRQAIGGILPIAGAVIGGIYGGPAGAALGGAAGGAIGSSFGGADAGAFGTGGSNDPTAGAAAGLGYGSYVSNFLKPGAQSGDWRQFFSYNTGQSSQPQAGTPTSGNGLYNYMMTGNSAPAATIPDKLSYPDSGGGGSYTPSVSGGYSVYGRPSTGYYARQGIFN